jgi:hypothetical protein
MSLFCFLWMPLFYLFWRSIAESGTDTGGVWALLLGSVVAFIRFLVGSFVNPGAFGLSRWFSACVDIVALPAVLPLLACAIFSRLRRVPGPANYANFALLWLIPGAAIRAVSWSTRNDPALLVLVPLLWTAIAGGIPFFIKMIEGPAKSTHAPAFAAMGALPFLSATVYWAFFAQKTALGFLLLAPTLAPLVISVAANWHRACETP